MASRIRAGSRQGPDDALLDAGARASSRVQRAPPGGPRRPCWPLTRASATCPAGPRPEGFLRGYAERLRRRRFRPRGAGLRRGVQERAWGRSRRALAAGLWRVPARTKTTTSTSTRNAWTPSAFRSLRLHITPRENERAMQKDMATPPPRCSKPPARRTFTPTHGARGRRTSSAPRAWAPIRRRRCSRRSSRRTTSGTCS